MPKLEAIVIIAANLPIPVLVLFYSAKSMGLI